MNYCKNCKHSHIVHDVVSPCSTLYCTLHRKTDYINGFVTYKRCNEVRDANNSHCKDWEKKESFWSKLFKKR